MQSRSKEAILATMVKSALSPINKTDIMYRANLSYSQLVKYLALLQNRDLLENRAGKWVATEQGRQFIDAYLIVMQFIGLDKEEPELETVARVVG
jgi:predicted transcriptional regulator